MKILRVDGEHLSLALAEIEEQAHAWLTSVITSTAISSGEALFVFVADEDSVRFEDMSAGVPPRLVSSIVTERDANRYITMGEAYLPDFGAKDHTNYVVVALESGADVLLQGTQRLQWCNGAELLFEDPDYKQKREEWAKRAREREKQEQTVALLTWLAIAVFALLLYLAHYASH